MLKPTIIQWARLGLRLIVAALVIYGAGIVGYLLARLLFGESWTPVALGNSLMPTLLFPTLPAVLILLGLRRWKSAGLLLPGALLLIVQYGGFLVRPVVAAPDSAPQIRVLTFNIASKTSGFQPIELIILSSDADVVTLQELLTPAADDLSAALADRYPYHALHPFDDYARGVGVFSRYPISDDFYFNEFALGAQRIRLTFDHSQSIIVYSAHPTSPRILGGYDASYRSADIGRLLADARQQTDPVLLAGDFNITDQTDDYGRIAAVYGDAFRSAGFGFGLTFPYAGKMSAALAFLPPIIRIDYVFFDRHWQALEAYRLGDSGGSDHYPFYARLALRQADHG